MIATEAKIEKLHVVPGYTCNLSCTHCASFSGPEAKGGMSDSQIEEVRDFLRINRIKKIQFSGGEPTLFSEVINKIVSGFSNDPLFEIKLTTNGWFSTSAEKIEQVFSKLSRPNILQLSWDRFHGSKITEENVILLRNYCQKNHIEFVISVCIGDPREMIEITEISSRLSIPIKFQKVASAGKAKQNKISYNYKKFEPEVLDKFCPNRGILTYAPEKGWSVCCSNLMFNNSKANQNHVHISADDHIKSRFYNLISNMNFGQILKAEDKQDLKTVPSDSHECNLCEKIFSEVVFV